MSEAKILNGAVEIQPEVHTGLGAAKSNLFLIPHHIQQMGRIFSRTIDKKYRTYETWKVLVHNTWVRFKSNFNFW